MNRSRTIINIIEGFKLGSLGAGRKPSKFVEPLEPEKQPQAAPQQVSEPQLSELPESEISMSKLDWLTGNPNFVDGTGAFDAVRWNEKHKWYMTVRFMFRCKRIGDDYSFDVFAGSKLQVTFKGDRPIPKGWDFHLMNSGFSSPTGTDAAKLFRKEIDKVKTAKSFGRALVSGRLGGEWEARLDADKHGLTSYLHNYIGHTGPSKYVK